MSLEKRRSSRRFSRLLLLFYSLVVVFAIWAVEIAWSVIWLRYYRFGPFEWLWRSLTYWKLQPMRRREAAEPALAAA